MSNGSRAAKQVAWLGALALLVAPAAWAQQAADFFRQNCMSCHTIGGGRITGPDLKNVSQRRDRAWLVKFLQNPKAAIDGGDPYALELQQQARGVIMPTVPGMSPAVAEALLNLIGAESSLPKSQFAGLGISDAPFTAAQAAEGEQIFSGGRRLAKGGPPCISCHATASVGGLGGGRLGPDLTRVYERLGGRRAAGMWLMAPATTTMQAVFRQRPLQPEEILPLLAYIEAAAAQPPQGEPSSVINFFLLGFGGMALGLVSAGAIWRGRLRGVRRKLVQGERAEVE
ncbi:MAG TPA: cytochrome c [Bryobacterales bacterium]|nr:cytochrome c [Bryobacterales bacterium]